MLNYDEYRNLCCLINENPDMISVFDNMSMFSIDELSIDSHDIKNHLAYLKTSFQLLKKKSPELSENKYIIRMEDVLSQLIYQNACEASDCTGEITLITRKSNKHVITEIINNGYLPSHDDSSCSSDYINLARPFYSTKSGHVGVGLSIIHQICLSSNGYARLTESDGKTILCIRFPIISEN